MSKDNQRPCTPEEIKLWCEVMKRNITVHPTFAKVNRLYDQWRSFEKTLDLHGMTVADAHQAALSFVETAYKMAAKEVTIITGKSGTIRTEFPTWMALSPHVKRIAAKNDGGAFTVTLK